MRFGIKISKMNNLWRHVCAEGNYFMVTGSPIQQFQNLEDY